MRVTIATLVFLCGCAVLELQHQIADKRVEVAQLRQQCATAPPETAEQTCRVAEMASQDLRSLEAQLQQQRQGLGQTLQRTGQSMGQPPAQSLNCQSTPDGFGGVRTVCK